MTTPPATLPPVSRSTGTRRTNRTGLALLGLVLLLAGAAGLASGLGVLGSTLRQQPVLAPTTADFARRNGWMWPVVAIIALVVALLALRWLAIQLRSDRVRAIDLEAERSRGETTLAASAVTAALASEIEGYRGVANVRAHLRGAPRHPDLVVRVTLDGRADLAEVRRRIETSALAHARAALDSQDLPTRLELRLAPQRRRALR